VRVLAYDLSLTATGVAYPDGTTATYRPPPPSKGATWREQAGRLGELEHRITTDLTVYVPDVVAIEGFSYGSKGSSVDQIYGLGWLVRMAVLESGLPLAIIPPSSVKKYATGSGNAKKPDMRMALYQRYQRDIKDDNECDAVWMWLMTRAAYGAEKSSMPKAQLEALKKIEWPALRGVAA
jgi:Holliday junction resolvasome RuvABC endonuclease subunit